MIIDRSQVSELERMLAVLQLAPNCRDCDGLKLHICLQKCCRQNSLYCNQCEKDRHFLHRTNNLQVMFINGPSIKQQRKILEEVNECQQVFITWQSICQELAKRLMGLTSAFVEVSHEAEQLKHNLSKEFWHQDILDCLTNYIKGRVKLPEAKRQFEEKIRKMDLYRQKQIDLPGLKDIKDKWEGFKRTLIESIASTKRVDKIVSASNHSNNFTIDEVLLNTSFHRYIEESSLYSKLTYPILKHSEDQSRVMNAATLKADSFFGSRLKLNGEPHQFISNEPCNFNVPNLKELHTTHPFLNYPNLKVLSIKTTQNARLYSLLSNIPLSLQTFRISIVPNPTDVSDFFDISFIAAKMSLLPNLKQLAIEAPGFTIPQVKTFVGFARVQQLRNLSLTYSTTSVRDFNLDRYSSGLKECSRNYRRKMMQALLIARSGNGYLRDASYMIKDFIMEVCDDKIAVVL